jgi:hypothetical protein
MSGQLWSVAPINLRDASYQLSIGPDRFYTPDSAFILGADTHELRSQVNDYSIVHHAWCTVERAQLAGLLATSSAPVVDAGGGGGTVAPVISYAALDIEGNGFTGLPATPPKLVIHSTSAALWTQADPADLATTNTRHLIVAAPPVPIVIDPTDKLTIEIQSALSGSGGSRWNRYYRVIIRFGLRTVDPSGAFVYSAL